MQSMKLLPIILVTLVLSLTCPAFAAEDLSDWTQVEWAGNITMTVNGTSVDIVADDAAGAGEAWRGLTKYFDKGIGATADIVVSQSSGNVYAGLRQYVGTTANQTNILAEIYADQYGDDKRIRYRIRERDSDGNTVQTIAVGYLGNYSGGWTTGEKITLGFAYFDEQIWFYTPNNGAFVKVQFKESLTDVDSEIMIAGSVYPAFDTNNISATVSNVSIIYPDNLQVFDVSEASREDIENFVTRFYQLCLNRQPDTQGLAWWADDLEAQKRTGADVARGFINSDEFLNKNTTDQEFLNILYQAFFNRDPDQDGLDTWTAELNAGKTRGNVLDGFIGSQEFAELCQSYGIKVQ